MVGMDQSPVRLFHTHMPYSVLPESIKKSNCKIVYITRNPKDTLVSMQHLFNKLRTPERGPYPLQNVFESFCNGVFHFGPFFDHVLQDWNESLKLPHKILFLKYEELKRNPKAQVKRLASFLGKPFAEEEEVEEVIHGPAQLGEAIKLGSKQEWRGFLGWDAEQLAHFSGHVLELYVGDWQNILTKEMSELLDQIASMKLKGSGLDLDDELQITRLDFFNKMIIRCCFLYYSSVRDHDLVRLQQFTLVSTCNKASTTPKGNIKFFQPSPSLRKPPQSVGAHENTQNLPQDSLSTHIYYTLFR